MMLVVLTTPAPDRHRRQLRLRTFDYTAPGAYFATLCTRDRLLLFGRVTNDEVLLSEAGKMVVRWWQELDGKFPRLRTDAVVVMPNHLHGVIVFEEQQPAGLAGVVTWLKTMTTNEYIRGVKDLGWPRFRGRLWQRNYYEHVIRDDRDLERVRGYISGNPARWSDDEENPDRRG